MTISITDTNRRKKEIKDNSKAHKTY